MNDENQTMIRFIDSSYRTLFFIPDGGTIIVTRSDGGKVKRACTFLDEYHTRVGRETYHICQADGAGWEHLRPGAAASAAVPVLFYPAHHRRDHPH